MNEIREPFVTLIRLLKEKPTLFTWGYTESYRDNNGDTYQLFKVWWGDFDSEAALTMVYRPKAGKIDIVELTIEGDILPKMEINDSEREGLKLAMIEARAKINQMYAESNREIILNSLKELEK